jgi:fumarylacetoacetate (FAA) hydrolase
MKLISFIPGKVDTLNADLSQARLGILKGEDVVDVALASNNTLPQDMISFLEGFDRNVEVAKKLLESSDASYAISEVTLLSPVPRPTSMRDGYAFRQHVEAARRNRGVEMIPEFDLFPVFYFTNHNGVIGEGPLQVMPEHLKKLDFELEAAIVIGKKGRNIKAADADSYIAGYTIMNDWSARYLQMEEMKLSLGPAKGKDFATALGPWLVTKDELESKRLTSKDGDRYDVTMTCTVNGKELSRGNLKDMTWSFAQLIERASYGVTLMPGDVIGSGTVGTGCLLELNGSKITDNLWIQVGDTVTCEIDMLGSLTNNVIEEKA